MPAVGLITADDVEAELCVVGGVDHDYRPLTYESVGLTRTSLVCVWCRVVACGDTGEQDPCIEPYHHKAPHRSRSGATWPVGESRP
jgi:hypothetical protein